MAALGAGALEAGRIMIDKREILEAAPAFGVYAALLGRTDLHGPLTAAPAVTRPSLTSTAWSAPPAARARRAAPARSDGPTHVYRCTVCGKRFNGKTMDGTLNPHKTPRGYDC